MQIGIVIVQHYLRIIVMVKYILPLYLCKFKWLLNNSKWFAVSLHYC